MSRGGIFEICGDDMKLKDICEINPRTLNIGDDTEVSFIPMPSVSEDGKIDTSDIRTYADVKKGYTTFKENDVLFAKITPCMENGKGAVACGLKNGYGCGSSEFHVLRATELVIPEWLYYLTARESFRKEAEKHMTGSAGQRRVPRQYLENYTVNIPLLSQQEQQVQILSRLKLTIDHRKEQLKAFDDLIKARFVELFSGESNMMKMSDICSIITDGTHQPPKFVAEGIPFIFVSNVVNDKITYDAEKFITQETYDELIKRTPIEIGDVLLSTVGSYGHPAVVKSDKKFLFQRHIAYLKPKKEIIDSDYLHGALLSPDAQRQIEEGVKGIAQKTLNLSEIKKMVIPVPDLLKQKQFANFVEQVDK